MYYGWRIVAVNFLACFLSVGFVFYSYGVFLKEVVRDLGGGRLSGSLGLTAMNFAVAVLSPLVGRALDEGLARRIMFLGASLLATGFMLGAHVTSLWQFHLLFGTLLGASACMLGPLTSSALVSNWFVSNRGKALAFATAGISASGVVLPPLAAKLVASFGWRTTFSICGLTAAVLLIPAIAFGVTARPEALGLQPHGAVSAGDTPRLDFAFDARQVLQTRVFIGIALLIALNFCCFQAVLTHLVPLLTDWGWRSSLAAAMLSLAAAAGLAGRPIFGHILDRKGGLAAVLWSVGLQMLGVTLLLASQRQNALIAIGVITFGLGMGAIVPLQGTLIADAFGRSSVGRVMGVMGLVMFPIVNIGLPLVGWVYDRYGDYKIALVSILGLYGMSLVFALLFGVCRSEASYD